MKRHELSALFGDMDDGDFNALVNDVRDNGVKDTEIIMYEGAILDGWHRVRAAKQAGRDDELERMRQDKTIFDPNVHGPAERFVLQRNRLRRHMTTIQRVIAAETLATRRAGRPAADDVDVSIAAAASDLGVSDTSVERWRYICKHGNAADGSNAARLAVVTGALSISAAFEQVRDARKAEDGKAEQPADSAPPAAATPPESPQPAAGAPQAQDSLSDASAQQPAVQTPAAPDPAASPPAAVAEAPAGQVKGQAEAPAAAKPAAGRGSGSRAELMAALAECQTERQALSAAVATGESERKLLEDQASPDDIEKLRELRNLQAVCVSLRAEIQAQRARYDDTIAKLKSEK